MNEITLDRHKPSRPRLPSLCDGALRAQHLGKLCRMLTVYPGQRRRNYYIGSMLAVSALA